MTAPLQLLDPIQVGDLRLPNRIFMAPLTRCRASAGRVPNLLMGEYYVQRASAGLILSEATAVSPMGVGYPDTPGIWSPEQVAGWTGKPRGFLFSRTRPNSSTGSTRPLPSATTSRGAGT